MQYKNHYGEAVIEIVSDYMSIKKVTRKYVPKGCWFNMDQAEQIALITDNRHLQIGFSEDLRHAYVIHHKNANTVAYCKVTSINFYTKSGESAREILAQEHSVAYPYW